MLPGALNETIPQKHNMDYRLAACKLLTETLFFFFFGGEAAHVSK